MAKESLSILHRGNEDAMISVKTFTGKTVSFIVKDSDTINNVKARIQVKEGIPVEEQALIFNKKALQDIHTLADLSITKESAVTLMRKSRFLVIFVKINKARTIYMEVNPSETISDLKARIQDKESIPSDQHVLTFNEMVLEDSGTFVDFNINNKFTLTLMRKLRGFMQMYVNISNAGKTVSLEVKPSDTIHNVKVKIKDKRGDCVDQQVLIFNEMVLEDNSVLADFSIKTGSALTLVLKSMDIIINQLNGKSTPLVVKHSDTIKAIKEEI